MHCVSTLLEHAVRDSPTDEVHSPRARSARLLYGRSPLPSNALHETPLSSAARLPLKKFFSPLVAPKKKSCTFAGGEMAEWSIAAVLKTVDPHGSGGSNPSLSAAICKTIRISKLQTQFAVFLFLNAKSNRRYRVKHPLFPKPIFRLHVLQKIVPKLRKVDSLILVFDIRCPKGRANSNFFCFCPKRCFSCSCFSDMLLTKTAKTLSSKEKTKY